MSNTMRHNSHRTGSRRSHHALKATNLSTDEKGTVHLRHRASLDTLTYRGKSIAAKAEKPKAKAAAPAKKAAKKTAKKSK